MPLIEKPLRPLANLRRRGRLQENRDMSFKFPLSAALLLAAAPALAQPPAAASPPPAAAEASGPQAAIQQTAMAFGQCVSTGAQHVDAAVTPEAGATTVLAGCTAQRTALEQAVEALLATLPADQQAAGRAQLQSQLAAVPTQVADGIRRGRAAAAAPPASAAPAH
jgi:hypothetical protein